MKYFVSAGEMSGDLHLSFLVKKMKEINPDASFIGAAGDKSKVEGVEVIQHVDDLAVMGFIEGLKKIKFLKEKAQEYIEIIKKKSIKNVILIDYGGFNIKLLEKLKKELPHVKVYFYIPPKVWIWGENRVKKLKLADYIVVIFPWEVDFYKKHNVDAVYFGNPFIDKYDLQRDRGNKILLLPGSREQEVRKMLPPMLETVRKRKKDLYILKLASKKHLEWIEQDISKIENLKVECNLGLEEVSKKCKLAIATSGTVTLELCLLGLPTIVVYKVSKFNEFVAKKILGVDLISLPNLTLDKESFPELLQEEVNPDTIIEKIEYLRANKEEVQEDIEEVRRRLGGENVVTKYAKFFLEGHWYE